MYAIRSYYAQSARHTYHVGYADLPSAQIAIEAVFEDLAVKRQVFAALDAALPETAILATNTSFLDPNRIAEGVRNPSRFRRIFRRFTALLALECHSP